MNARMLWSRILVVVGGIAMLLGAIDPLEGSLIILIGSVLIAVGVGLMWGVSAFGGLGGTTGRSLWWGLVILPYPVGWIMGIIGLILRLIEFVKGKGQKNQP
jgi:hypothetical protein